MIVTAPAALQIQWPRMSIDRRPQARSKPKEQEKARDKNLRALKEAFETARAYVKAKDASRRSDPVPEDARWEAMRPFLDGTLPVVVDAEGSDQIEAALDWAETAGVKLILSGGADAWRVADRLAERDVPVILGPVLRLPSRQWEPYDTAYTSARKLHDAGVRFCISTGGSTFGAAHIRNLPYHAAMAASFGLPADEAIRSITLSPAEILGVGDRIGSIEKKKDATLILTDGNPLEIRTQVLRAWIDGREVGVESRHTRLYQRYKARP